MNTTFTIESLTEWVESIKEAAKEDTTFSIAWFKPTENTPFSIIAGWVPLFETSEDDFSDIFCCSKSNPKYVMCIKVASNDSPAYTDFDLMNVPIDKNGEVDDTCVPLEWEDSPEVVAGFYLHEWDRLMEEHEEEF